MLGRNLDTVQVPGNLGVTGTLTAYINGAGITNLNATSITSGTVDNARLGVVPIANGGTGSATGSGAGLTNLNASNITSGTLNNARLGVVPIANGGTGSVTKNFVDLINPQTVGGDKTFSSTLSGFIVNTSLQYNIVGQRVLTSSALGNLFAGFGAGAGTTGINNSFFGTSAGGLNLTGNDNSFFGMNAGNAITTGGRNTLIGSFANVGANNLFNASAIGYRAFVTQSNALVLGGIDGVNGATAGTNVGIGTTSPAALLEVSTSTDTGTAYFTKYTNLPDLSLRLTGRRFRGTESSPSTVLNGDQLFEVGAAGYNGESPTFPSAVIEFRATEDFTNTAIGTSISFSTSANGGSTRTGRMIIDHDGRVGIGTFIPNDKLQVSGNIRVGTSGTNGCVKNFNGDGIVGTCSSDARLKQKITPFPSTLDNLVTLRPVHFYWRAKEYPSMKFGESQSFGLIAQEVEQVMPELVTEDEEGMKAVRYNKLPLLMLQAIKELKAENDALKRELQEISQKQERIDQQQSQIESLRKLVCQGHPNAEACR